MVWFKSFEVILPALALTACAANASTLSSVANEPIQRSDRLAEALANADAAATNGDAAKLAEALRTIERLDAKPLTDEDGTALEKWKAASVESDVPMRGRTLGPAYRSGLVSAGARAVITQTFYGGAPANVSLRVADGSALKIRITDKSDRNVCERSAREASCRWMPLYTQVHRIELVNDREQNARYYIVFD